MKKRSNRKKTSNLERYNGVQAASSLTDSAVSDAQISGEWVRNAQVIVPQTKQAISFRVDPDVLDFFKEQGPRYQTRMNAVLRAYMTAHGEEGGS